MPEKFQPRLLAELKKINERHGGIPFAERAKLAEKLDVPVTLIEGSASSYPFLTEPRAKRNIRLCKSLSCTLEESRAVSRAIRKELKISRSGVSQDGKWSFVKVNCLGLCGDGPAMLINGREYTSLTPEKALAAIRRIRDGE